MANSKSDSSGKSIPKETVIKEERGGLGKADQTGGGRGPVHSNVTTGHLPGNTGGGTSGGGGKP